MPGELLLVDTGGQYPDGTTDVTRTLAVGPVPPEASAALHPGAEGHDRHVAPALARGPCRAATSTPSPARALWRAGLDYDHGTGHGVGAYLGVHEGPQRLSRRGLEPLLPGMILSIEPGYYREGAFGIRIENLAVVTPARGARRAASGRCSASRR